ncbi:MAG: sigma-70 family RNA polymerase sigma factor [Paludisphaera borealis]|uniref:RNA polymerase sigma factor n=1 Tax=Paludisphaera borealis TaxID=1387353 RepID=UPI0028403108|nr:sigma-70 family RNA polymerase sigma factor [Paludisphaera borealis]MDR3622930.1 sigma-70 family RNA polymerase sigma factor [Paludisphaera borealis]
MTDDLDRIEERLTVLLAQQGDRDAFGRLVDRYDKRLHYFIRRILGETDGALDLLQSVWLIVHRRLRRLQSPDAFRVWLYRIAHDQAVTELRRKTRRPVLFDETAAGQPLDAVSLDDSAFENAELVHVALRDLSVDHRRVLTLRFLEDMSIEEIAEVVGCGPGTVKSRLHYAKLALRRRIEELLDG